MGLLARRDSQVGAALTAAAVPLWVQLSLLAECRERTELASARLDPTAANAPRLRMQLSAARGWSLMYGVGRAREAGPAWAATLQLAEQLGDRDYLLRALWGLCIDQFNNGEFRRALEFANRFAEVVADSGNPVDRMMADRLLATTLHYRGDQRLAIIISGEPCRGSPNLRRSRRSFVSGSTCGSRRAISRRGSCGCLALRIRP